jgi:hypothetical protein
VTGLEQALLEKHVEQGLKGNCELLLPSLKLFGL